MSPSSATVTCMLSIYHGPTASRPRSALSARSRGPTAVGVDAVRTDSHPSATLHVMGCDDERAVHQAFPATVTRQVVLGAACWALSTHSSSFRRSCRPRRRGRTAWRPISSATSASRRAGRLRRKPRRGLLAATRAFIPCLALVFVPIFPTGRFQTVTRRMVA